MSPFKVLATAAAFALAAQGALAQPSPEAKKSAEIIKAHMSFLASDLLQGREPGTPGYDIAANYAAAQFALLGLTPAGDDGGWFQHVPMLSYRSADTGALSLKGRDGRPVALTPNEDFIISRNPVEAETKLSAPLVFVGYGIVAPERGRDDYRGLDVKGKIVVVLDGAPRSYQSEERAYYRSARTKRVEAEKRGAVGAIFVNTPVGEKMQPFSQSARAWRSWSMTWRDKQGAPFVVAPKTPALATVSVQGAAKLFAGAPTPLEAIYAAAETPAGETPRFALPFTAEAVMRTELQESRSANVAGLIPGSDPKLAAETIVLSAHLDHIGVRASGEGDRINNGALDNAGGVATTFEVARAFMESGRRPKRSVLVLLVTAEEKGLVGAEYFARNPTVPLDRIVANVNLDMPILTYDFTDVVAFGADRSAIGPAVKRAAGRLGVALSPDPLPDEGLFTRSDHYRFVEVGVPSVFLMTGFQNGGEAQFRGFLKDHYHKPSDQLDLPIDYLAGAKFARINYEIARELADGPERPAWNKGDFFGGKFGGRAQVADH